METYMKNLRNTLLQVMGKKRWTIVRFSVECEVSLSHTKRILSGNADDVKLSTLEKISCGIKKPISVIIGEVA